jgi:predicted transcriptional regulator
MTNQIHIGKTIKLIVKSKQMTVTEFAEKINYTSRNAYKIFAKCSIDTALLSKISKVLEKNLFMYYLTQEEISELSTQKTKDIDLLNAVKDLKTTILNLNNKNATRKH